MHNPTATPPNTIYIVKLKLQISFTQFLYSYNYYSLSKLKKHYFHKNQILFRNSFQ